MKSPSLPNYLETVIRECKQVELQWVQHSVFPMPNRHSPIVISVVRDEADRLEDFLRHYRYLGIERFVFVDNGSTDGTRELLAAQPDVDLCLRMGTFNWMLKQGWINRVIETYGYDQWYVYADADEQIVFDGCDRHTFADLAWCMEQQGLSRVRGFLIDMYTSGPLMKSLYRSGLPLLDAYPWLDGGTYKEERYREIMSVKGGPRPRAFGHAEADKFKPELTKYPLFKLRPGEYMANPHHIWPFEGNFESPRHLGLLHFKFLPRLLDRIKDAILRQNYWEGSYEYKCYLRALEEKPLLSLHFEGSVRFESAGQLASLGLLAPIEWGDIAKPSDIARAAFRHRRHELLTKFWPRPSRPALPSPPSV